MTRVDILPSKFISSPLGLVPKSNGTWRRVHHLSHPEGSSVNDFIPQEWGALEYPTFDDAVAKIRQQGKGCILVKRDFSDAFRHIPVAKSDWWLLGFQWDNVYWMERFLPFGLRTSPFLFDLFAKGINWMCLQNQHDVLHYLDDFLAVCRTNPEAEAFTRYFFDLCKDLGIAVNEKKNKTGHVIDFLGIELDTMLMEARLPPDKLQKAKDLVKQALQKSSIRREELDSLVGFLSFAAKVVVPGRAFLRRLFNAKAMSRGRHIHINENIKADLQWWHLFLPKWNGIRMLDHPRETFRLWTDASGYGIGAYILVEDHTSFTMPAEHALSERFTSRLRPTHINVKEMTAILHALRKWLPLCAGSHVIFHCDNFAVTSGIRKSSIRGNAMRPLRAIAMLTAIHDIRIEIR